MAGSVDKVSRSGPHRSVRSWFWLGLKFLCGLFISVHIYALVLFYVPVPATVTMAQRVLQGETIRRHWTKIEDLSPHLIQAVIAAEDTRFCRHMGVDIDAIMQALGEHENKGRLRGASTITQQTAKNVFLWNGGGFIRKFPEAWLAVFIDTYWGKRRIMEVYLNVAEWGDGLFGAEAAAQARFGKSAADLNAREAALLAAVLPSPHKWRLDPASAYVKSRAATLQARMLLIQRDQLQRCVQKLD